VLGLEVVEQLGGAVLDGLEVLGDHGGGAEAVLERVRAGNPLPFRRRRPFTQQTITSICVDACLGDFHGSTSKVVGIAGIARPSGIYSSWRGVAKHTIWPNPRILSKLFVQVAGLARADRVAGL